MKIISHRGFWREPEEKNRPTAFARSFEAGFGTETDLRDRGGLLVIAHDMASDRDIRLPVLLDMLEGRDLPLAINVKADGIGPALATEMQRHGLHNWFTFDMSVPEMVAYLRLGLPVYTRASEIEQSPACYDQATGIWLDMFEHGWYQPRHIAGFLNDGKKVCAVSAELHGRDPNAGWEMLRDATISGHPDLMLCTDRPAEAAAFFGEAA